MRQEFATKVPELLYFFPFLMTFWGSMTSMGAAEEPASRASTVVSTCNRHEVVPTLSRVG